MYVCNIHVCIISDLMVHHTHVLCVRMCSWTCMCYTWYIHIHILTYASTYIPHCSNYMRTHIHTALIHLLLLVHIKSQYTHMYVCMSIPMVAHNYTFTHTTYIPWGPFFFSFDVWKMCRPWKTLYLSAPKTETSKKTEKWQLQPNHRTWAHSGKSNTQM